MSYSDELLMRRIHDNPENIEPFYLGGNEIDSVVENIDMEDIAESLVHDGFIGDDSPDNYTHNKSGGLVVNTKTVPIIVVTGNSEPSYKPDILTKPAESKKFDAIAKFILDYIETIKTV